MLKSDGLKAKCSPSSEGESCLVCLSVLEKTAVRGILPCEHFQFCLHCILGWAEVTNKCPVCKSRFTYIHSGVMKRNKLDVLNRIEVEEREQGGFIIENLSIVCKICGGANEQDRLLLCDRCGEGAHIACLSMEEYPQLDEWYCDTCLAVMPHYKQMKQWKNMKAAGRPAIRRSLRLSRRSN